MKIGIVNDLKLAVRALTDVLKTRDDLEVAWIAEDGRQGLELCRQSTPDLVLMDIVMPVMDGVEATRRIMQDAPCAILVVTATVEGNLSKVYEALGAGALDAVDGPRYHSDGSLENESALLRKIDTIRRLQDLSGVAVAAPPAEATKDLTRKPIIAIGASTGGPDAVATILRELPPGLDAPIVVVQHLDAQFVPGLVVWLGHHTRRTVETAREDSHPEPGHVLVAHSDDHLVMDDRGHLGYRREPLDLVFRPSVDVFFESLAHGPARPGVAVLLTGMGRDGAQGLLALRKRGWRTIAQDQETSVVYGMPKAARELDAADRVEPLGRIANAVAAAWTDLAGEGVAT
jgi:two-component system response regulator WspF